MKWKAKYPANPKFGDMAVQKEFAFLPTRVGEHWVWLESYYEMYVFRLSRIGMHGDWRATEPHPTRSLTLPEISEETTCLIAFNSIPM